MKQKTVSKTKDARPMFTVRVGWMMLGEHRIHADSREEAKSIAGNRLANQAEPFFGILL